MNKLPLAERVQILQLLCEGASMRSISRVCDVSINTVMKLLEDAGEACAAYQFNAVRDVRANRVQCDEIWSFCCAKERNVATAKSPSVQAGDVWTWTAIDPDTKLMISWMVGERDALTANLFVDDLASRLANRVQITTDGHKLYLDAVAAAFAGDVDYAMLVKLYGEAAGGAGPERKYSPGECTGTKKRRITGNPDPAAVSTSIIERSNLTMRMALRRFTRLTNAFSKKIDNHIHAMSIYFVWYNFCRIQKSLRVSPAMAAGVTDRLMSFEDIVAIVDAAKPSTARPSVALIASGPSVRFQTETLPARRRPRPMPGAERISASRTR